MSTRAFRLARCSAFEAVKLFHFYRHEDQSGVSGTGPVVEGVEFTNGWCALRWISQKSSICFYRSLEDVKAIHSHGGKTELIIHDFDALRRRETPREVSGFEIVMKLIEETSRLLTYANDPNIPREEFRRVIQESHQLLDRLEHILGAAPSRAA